jgi:Tfp pilus assembly protein FimT
MREPWHKKGGRHSGNPESGFTLIELVLIIVVVAILGAVFTLILSGLSTAKVNNAINKVVADLRYAQQLSITTQSRHGLTIDSTAQYTVHRNVPPDTAVQDPVNLGSTFVVNFDAYQQNQLNGVRFSSSTPFCPGATSNVIEFDKLGAPTDTVGTVLTCTSTIGFAGTTRTITIAPNTGNITY